MDLHWILLCLVFTGLALHALGSRAAPPRGPLPPLTVCTFFTVAARLSCSSRPLQWRTALLYGAVAAHALLRGLQADAAARALAPVAVAVLALWVVGVVRAARAGSPGAA